MSIKKIIQKLLKDNLGSLGAIVSWSILTSVVPIIVGLIAISGFVLRNNPSAQQSVVSHLSQALRGVVQPNDIRKLVSASTQHTGLLGVVGLLGVLWGGSSVGGAISTTFQAIFEVDSRNFIVEKLIDIAMIFVFTALMLVILLGTAAGAMVKTVFTSLSIPDAAAFVVGTAISLLAAFLLYESIYLVFPNVRPRLKFRDAWKGALVGAVLFEILSFIWPLYATFAHFQKDGAILGSLVLLMAWVYFFSMTMLLGAEVVAIGAISDANKSGGEVGPEPENSVPQHRVLREDGGQNEANGQDEANGGQDEADGGQEAEQGQTQASA
jgi:membrane protein